MSFGKNDSVAIIGMASRLPGANSKDEYWDNLVNGVKSIVRLTDDELRESGFSDDEINAPEYVKFAGYLENIEYFDASFFGITPREAEITDPQHRIFIECAWHVLEDAGYDPDQVNDKIGVFSSVDTPFYLFDLSENKKIAKYTNLLSLVIANDKDYLATRVSYLLNLTGHSLSVQSACSSALAGIILAADTLLSGQNYMMLAGGCSATLPQKVGYTYQQGGIESPDGQCRVFDKESEGTVFTSGVGCVLLKRTEDAIKDGDHIYAVIKGSAINNDGARKSGFTSPSVEGQVKVAVEALEMSGISAREINFVEAHGTGTIVGDAVEFASLTETFRNYTKDNQFCLLGTAKPNIGHTDTASGVSGLIKAALSIKNRKCPPLVNFEEANPKFEIESSPFFINKEVVDFSHHEKPLSALVNSFGIGGTNACIILGEAPEVFNSKSNHEYKLFLLSANMGNSLKKMIGNLKDFFVKNSEVNIDDAAYTLQVGRRRYKYNCFLYCRNREEAIKKLESNDYFLNVNNLGVNRKTVFMFPGQGNQYLQMGRDLYKTNKFYKKEFNRCCKILEKNTGLNLLELLYSSDLSKEKTYLDVKNTSITQPAIFVVSYVLARLLMRYGIHPHLMIGHSVGEYVAACVSGVMSLEDALLLIAKRGELIQQLPEGAMLAVLLPEKDVAKYIKGTKIDISVINSPNFTVLSGPIHDVDDVRDELKKRNIFCKKLDASHAFHSFMMDPVLLDFKKEFDNVKLSPPKIPFISTVTGEEIKEEEATSPDYWVNHVRNPVRFSDAVKKIIQEKELIFLEVGPGNSLESAVKDHVDKSEGYSIYSTMRSSSQSFNDNEFLAKTLGNLVTSGVNISWKEYYRGEKRLRLPMPLYPFDRKKYILKKEKLPVIVEDKKDIKNQNIDEWFYQPSFKKATPIECVFNSKNLDDVFWIIFSDKLGFAEIISKKLSADKKQDVHIVGSEFEIPTNISKGKRVNVLCLFGLSDKSMLNRDNYTAAAETYFYSLLRIQQEFIRKGLIENLHMIIAANGVFNVIHDQIFPEKALMLGPARTVSNEHFTFKCKLIDTDIADKELVADRLICESCVSFDDRVIAYRNGDRYVEDYEQIQLGVEFEDKRNSIKIKESGVYLITGGLGGLGREFAKYFAEKAKPTLALVYRTNIPDREEWRDILKNPSVYEDSVVEKIRSIVYMEKLGARVRLYNANVNSYEQMKAVIDDVKQECGNITGVLHSAGISGVGVLLLKTKELAKKVIDPKFIGTIILDELVQAHKLDFFVLFSSVNSVLGEAGRVDYCSANSFLDSFAHYKNSLEQRAAGKKYISINWHAWSGAGMAEDWERMKLRNESKVIQAEVAKDEEKSGIKLIRKKDKEILYEITVDKEKSWIIKDHLVFGDPAMVGTAFINFIYECARMENQTDTVVLESFYFLNVYSGNCKLFIEWKKFQSKYKLVVKSDEGEHAICELTFLSPSSVKAGKIDVDECKKKFVDPIQISIFEEWSVTNEVMPAVSFGERWDILTSAYKQESEWLAKIDLKKKYSDDLKNFPLHPAVLDVGIMLGIHSTMHDIEGSDALPVGFNKMIIHSQVPANIYSAIKLTNDPEKTKQDLFAFDVNLFDNSGNLLVEIDKYFFKGVSLDSSGVVKKGYQYLSKNISLNEGTEAFSRILSNPYFSNIVVSHKDLGYERKMVNQGALGQENFSGKANLDEDDGVEHLRPSVSTNYRKPEGEIELVVSKGFSEVLGLKDVGSDDDFMELGGNSLLVVHIVSFLNSHFSLNLQIDAFYENPTVAKISSLISMKLSKEVVE